MDLTPRGRTLLIICYLFITLDFVVVGLRLWARRLKGKRLQLNDYLIFLGLVRGRIALVTSRLWVPYL